MPNTDLLHDISTAVQYALTEDIGTDLLNGDITARLIPESQTATAHIITRDHAVICGIPWVNEVFKQLDPALAVIWHVADGDNVEPNQRLFTLKGNTRSILTGERAALNFLQTLSGTATVCKHYSEIVSGTAVKLLDTRKTIPGLRNAQKYAVSCGGCFNHRIGLYDAFLIKENHIAACGSISAAIANARKIKPEAPVEVEVENFEELEEALNAKADIIMLDNFSIEETCRAVSIAKGIAKLEASGNITKETLKNVAETGVDYISIGALTKHCQAVDLSLRLER